MFLTRNYENLISNIPPGSNLQRYSFALKSRQIIKIVNTFVTSSEMTLLSFQLFTSNITVNQRWVERSIRSNGRWVVYSSLYIYTYIHSILTSSLVITRRTKVKGHTHHSASIFSRICAKRIISNRSIRSQLFPRIKCAIFYTGLPITILPFSLDPRSRRARHTKCSRSVKYALFQRNASYSQIYSLAFKQQRVEGLDGGGEREFLSPSHIPGQWAH